MGIEQAKPQKSKCWKDVDGCVEITDETLAHDIDDIVDLTQPYVPLFWSAPTRTKRLKAEPIVVEVDSDVELTEQAENQDLSEKEVPGCSAAIRKPSEEIHQAAGTSLKPSKGKEASANMDIVKTSEVDFGESSNMDISESSDVIILDEDAVEVNEVASSFKKSPTQKDSSSFYLDLTDDLPQYIDFTKSTEIDGIEVSWGDSDVEEPPEVADEQPEDPERPLDVPVIEFFHCEEFDLTQEPSEANKTDEALFDVQLEPSTAQESLQSLQNRADAAEHQPVTETNEELLNKLVPVLLNGDDSTEMKLIVQKLRKRFNNADRGYKESTELRSLLTETMHDENTPCVRLEEVFRFLESHPASGHRKRRVDVPQADEVKTKQRKVEAAIAEADGKEEATTEEAEMETSSAEASDADQIAAYIAKLKEGFATLVEWEDDDDGRAHQRASEILQKIRELEGGGHKVHVRAYDGSEFPQFNHFVNKLLKLEHSAGLERIQKTLEAQNRQHSFGLSATRVRDLAVHAHGYITEERKKRRPKKLQRTFDYVTKAANEDPANEDPELMKKLQENAKLSEDKLNGVLESFSRKAQADAELNRGIQEMSENEERNKAEHLIRRTT